MPAAGGNTAAFLSTSPGDTESSCFFVLETALVSDLAGDGELDRVFLLRLSSTFKWVFGVFDGSRRGLVALRDIGGLHMTASGTASAGPSYLTGVPARERSRSAWKASDTSMLCDQECPINLDEFILKRLTQIDRVSKSRLRGGLILTVVMFGFSDRFWPIAMEHIKHKCQMSQNHVIHCSSWRL